ncbi:MAG: LptF/LptG family permease [Chitinivibrionales bacterium]|nr:LptF/LptG family permease [Chitinivibrionales bacterium]
MILYRYIIRKHILPLLYSFAVLVFVLMMQLAVKLLNRIISKGLEPLVVLELFLIQMGWVVALAVPMAVLVATLMTFGGMSADNEILAIKASGRSLYSLLVPVLLSASLLALLLMFFNNLVLPEANHRAANLTSDISRKKPEAFIEPGVLIRDFNNYVLHVKKVDSRTGMLREVKIFSDAPGSDPSTTVADSGRVKVTSDGEYLRLTLFDGESHSIDRSNSEEHFVGRFDRQVLFIKNVDSQLRRTDRTYRSDREKSAYQMLDDVDGFRKTQQARREEFQTILDSTRAQVLRLQPLVDSVPLTDSALVALFDTVSSFDNWLAQFPSERRRVLSRLHAAGNRVSRLQQQLTIQQKKINQYLVEVHKKYSIPVTTLVFVLIGAPLGIMARRGGLAVGATYSVFFFVLFWAFLIGGETLADRLLVTPAVAMWSGNVIVGICGLVLVVRMVRETTFISFGPLLHLWRKSVGLAARPARLAPIALMLRVLRVTLNAPFWCIRRVAGILPIYLMRKFLGFLVGALAAMVTIFVVLDYISNLRKFEGAPFINIALYYWYYLPWIALTVLPIIVLMATMGAVGSMAKHSELTAMRGAGISILQLALPLLFIGALISVGSFYVGELVIPEANYRREELKEDIADERASFRTGRKRAHREFRRNFFYFGDNRSIYCFQEFRTHPTRTKNVWRERFDGSRIEERVQAASLDYIDSTWYFIDGVARTFTEDSSMVMRFDTLLDTVLTATPDEMVVRLKGKEEMSYWELADYIQKVKRQGEKVIGYMADLHFKIALPTMNLIVLLLGVSITARSGRKGGAVLFGVGLLLTFGYWILSQFALAFARNGHMPPLAGAWLGNACFLLLGLVLFKRAMR